MRISIIAAVADDGVIGRDGALPWRLPADLRFFRRVTMGHHVIVGRKTWDSIGRPLPGRTLVVLTRDRTAAIPGVHVVGDLTQALECARAAGDSDVFVAGGA
ncbi:MAG: dihydrofolate reductase, partial [Myxococcales bacterium]|nr:dihydrofolate reductase [Myxococcales bacterium]